MRVSLFRRGFVPNCSFRVVSAFVLLVGCFGVLFHRLLRCPFLCVFVSLLLLLSLFPVRVVFWLLVLSRSVRFCGIRVG